MKNLLQIILFFNLLLVPAISLLASGSYFPSFSDEKKSVNPLQPIKEEPVDVFFDKSRYSLGQKVFSEKIKFDEVSISPDTEKKQLEELKKIKSDIIKQIDEQIKIEQLAGRLNQKQLLALKYYLNVRFNPTHKHKNQNALNSNNSLSE